MKSCCKMSEYPSVSVSPPPYDAHVRPSGENPSNNPYAKRVGSPNQTQWDGANRYVTTEVVNGNINEIENHMVWSVLNILFCCFCLGFVACYYSTETKNYKIQGNFQAALAASRSARTINIIATVLGVIITINYVIYHSGMY